MSFLVSRTGERFHTDDAVNGANLAAGTVQVLSTPVQAPVTTVGVLAPRGNVGVMQFMTVTKGAKHVVTYHRSELSHRQFCRLCGGHLMTRHPPLNMVDVFAATIPELEFTPQVHVNYAETVLPMRDGLPKLKDFPAEFGGSGIAVPE